MLFFSEVSILGVSCYQIVFVDFVCVSILTFFFLAETWGFSTWIILSFTNRDNLTSSVPIHMYLFLSFVISLADFQFYVKWESWKADTLLLFMVIQCAVGWEFSYKAFIMFLPYIICSEFSTNACWILLNVFLHLLRWSYDLCPFYCWCDTLHLLIYLYWTILTSLIYSTYSWGIF